MVQIQSCTIGDGRAEPIVTPVPLARLHNPSHRDGSGTKLGPYEIQSSVHFVEGLQNQRRKPERTLVERLDLDNRCAVVAADPKSAGVPRIVDIYAADVGRARQHVFRVPAALDIQARHTVR